MLLPNKQMTNLPEDTEGTVTELRLPDGVHHTLDYRDDSMHVKAGER